MRLTFVIQSETSRQLSAALSEDFVHILSAEKIISADIQELLISRVWKWARKSLQTHHTLEITRFNANPLTAADRKCVLQPPDTRDTTSFQPHRQYKYWPNTFLQTTDMLQFYIS